MQRSGPSRASGWGRLALDSKKGCAIICSSKCSAEHLPASVRPVGDGGPAVGPTHAVASGLGGAHPEVGEGGNLAVGGGYLGLGVQGRGPHA